MSLNRVFGKLGITSAGLNDKKKSLTEEKFEQAKTLHQDTAQQELIKQQLKNLPNKRAADYESAQVGQSTEAKNALTNLQTELDAIYGETDGIYVTKQFMAYVENANGYARVIEDYLKIVDEYLKTGSKESQNDKNLRREYNSCKLTLDSYNAIYAKYSRTLAAQEAVSADKTNTPNLSRMR